MPACRFSGAFKQSFQIKTCLILSLVITITLVLFSSNIPLFNQSKELNKENVNPKVSDLDFTNATVISDGIQDIIWNDGMSRNPDIALDSSGNIHVVWDDDTDGTWGTDTEIMYASYSPST